MLLAQILASPEGFGRFADKRWALHALLGALPPALFVSVIKFVCQKSFQTTKVFQSKKNSVNFDFHVDHNHHVHLVHHERVT